MRTYLIFGDIEGKLDVLCPCQIARKAHDPPTRHPLSLPLAVFTMEVKANAWTFSESNA
jgi:hypothetical protein